MDWFKLILDNLSVTFENINSDNPIPFGVIGITAEILDKVDDIDITENG